MNLKQLTEEKQVLIVCGSGGVGKTTTAAAIAMQAAIAGKRTLVLTIDPARRLASSMGLQSITDEPTPIARRYFPVTPEGTLHAMMLDTKRTFDRVIENYAPSEAAKQAILKNRLYQHMSNMIAGSQEYMAMEKLYQIYYEGDYDLIVLDTPPTRNALNFLAAPRKMVDMTKHSMLRWFLKPGLFAGRIGMRLFGKSTEKVITLFDQLAGLSFLHELSEMIGTLAEMIGGFGDRAAKVYDLLRAKDVDFLLVTTPEKMALQDALYFQKQIGSFELPLSGIIFNRVHTPLLPDNVTTADVEKRLKDLTKKLRDPLLANFQQSQTQIERHTKLIRDFQKKCSGHPIFLKIPFLETDIHDMQGLAKINEHLFQAA